MRYAVCILVAVLCFSPVVAASVGGDPEAAGPPGLPVVSGEHARDTETGTDNSPVKKNPTFYIVIYRGVDPEPVEKIAPMISEELFGIPVKILDERPVEPQKAYVEIRDMYYAGRMHDELVKMKPENSLGLVAITSKDIYIGRLPFVRGSSDPGRGVAVISTFRLNNPSEYRFRMRILKEILHELGHILGQEHEIDPKLCVMGQSMDMIQLDAKSRHFCPYHRERIKEYLKNEVGIDISELEITDTSGEQEGDNEGDNGEQ